MMMFQLIGVPTLNQVGREVPPKYSSLTSSGLYVLITSTHTYFWIGQEFFSLYLSESTYKQLSHLISNFLMSKLHYLFDKATDELAEDEKDIVFMVEGREEVQFLKKLVPEVKAEDEDTLVEEEEEGGDGF
jgi:hypothetical protein